MPGVAWLTVPFVVDEGIFCVPCVVDCLCFMCD